ncbi:mucin-3A [Scomber scombrus]|uniref:Adhesion G-protein coupled receptor G2 n=1 Tax=Scomber scombrus TaxID=13677 RepID=A0AAV1P9R2_SCOSC
MSWRRSVDCGNVWVGITIAVLLLCSLKALTVFGYFLGDTKAVLNGCKDHWTLQDRAAIPLLFQMTVCVDIRVVVPGAWVAFSYSSVHSHRPELGLEGDDTALYGWLLRVRHRFPLQLSPKHWHRVCLRRDVLGNSFSLEVDGKMVAERTVIGEAIPPSGSLWLGCRPRDRPPGAVLGEVEVYLFRIWADLGHHGICEDGTVIGWNAKLWGLTSPNARQRDPNLPCDHRRLKRELRDENNAITTTFGRLFTSPTDFASLTPTSSPVIATPVTDTRKQTQFTASTSPGVTAVYSSQSEPSSVTPSSNVTSPATLSPHNPTTASNTESTTTDWTPSDTTVPATGHKTNSYPAPVSATTDAIFPTMRSTLPSNTNTETSITTTLPDHQTTPRRSVTPGRFDTNTFGSSLVNCDISKLCSSKNAYFWMSISVDAKGGKTEKDVHNLVSKAFNCYKGNANHAVTGFLDFCQVKVQEIKVNCSAKRNFSKTNCNVLLRLKDAVSVCKLQHNGNSALQEAGDEHIKAKIIGEVERVGRDLCGEVKPSGGSFVRCTSSSAVDDICKRNQHSNLTCSLIEPNFIPASQPKTETCGREAPQFCDCTAFCNSTSQFFSLRININSTSVNKTSLQKLVCTAQYGLTIFPDVWYVLTLWPYLTVVESTSSMQYRDRSAHLECHGTQRRLYSCMVILEMSGRVNACSLSKLLQQLFDSNGDITNERPLTHMVVCGHPGLTVRTLLKSNLTWVASDLLMSDTCQPNSTLLKCEANETLAVLLNDICPQMPLTTTLSTMHPSTQTESIVTIATEATPPTVTNTTQQTNTTSENAPATQQENASQGTTQPNMTTPFSAFDSTQSPTVQPVLQTSSPYITAAVSDNTTPQNTTSFDNTTLLTPTENMKLQNTTTARHNTSESITLSSVSSTLPNTTTSASNRTLQSATTSSMNSTLNTTTLSPNHTTEYNTTTAKTFTTNATTQYNATTANTFTPHPNHTTMHDVTTAINTGKLHNSTNSTSNPIVSTFTTSNNYTAVYNATTVSNNHTTEYNATTASTNYTTEYNATTASTNYTTEYNATTASTNYTTDNNATTASTKYTTENSVTTASTNYTTENNATTASTNYTTENNATTASTKYTTEYNATTASTNYTTEYNATTASTNYKTENSVTTASTNNTTVNNATTASTNYTTENSVTTASTNNTTVNNATTASTNYTTVNNATTASTNYTTENNATTASTNYTTVNNATTASTNYTTENNATTASTNNTTENNATTASTNYTTVNNATTASTKYTTENNATTASTNYTTENNATIAPTNYTTVNNATTASTNYTTENNATTASTNYTTENNATTASTNYTTENYATTASTNYTTVNNNNYTSVVDNTTKTTVAPLNNQTTNYTTVSGPHSSTTTNRNDSNSTTATSGFSPMFNLNTTAGTENNATTASTNYTTVNNATTVSTNYTTENNATTAPTNYTTENNATIAPTNYTTVNNATTASTNYTTENNATTASTNYTTENNATTASTNYTTENNATTASTNYTTVNNATTASTNYTTDNNATTASTKYTTENNATTASTNYTTENYATTASTNYTTENSVTTASTNYTTENNATTASNIYTTENNATTASTNYATENNATTTSTNYTTENSVTTASTNYTTENNATTAPTNYTTENNATTASTNYTTKNNATTAFTNYTTENSVTTASTNYTTENQTTNYTTVSGPNSSTTTNRNDSNSTTATSGFSPMFNLNTTAGTSFNVSSTAGSLTTDFIVTTKGPSTTANTLLEHTSTTSTSTSIMTTTATTAHGSLPAKDNTTIATVSLPSVTTTTTLQITTLTSTTKTIAGNGITTTNTDETTNSQVAQVQLADILLNETQDASQLNPSEVVQLVDNLEKLLDGPTVSETVGKKTINIVSNLMKGNSQALSASANRLIQLVDRLGLKLAVTSDTVILSSNSLVLAIKPVDGTNFPTTSFNIFNTNNVQFRGLRRSRSLSSKPPMGSVFLPSSLTEGLSPEDKQQASRVQFTFYTESALFQDATLKNDTLVSPVLGSSVANMSISNLTQNIHFTIRNINPVHANFTASCVFWDFTLNGGGGGWSSAGCSVVNVTPEDTTCSCNHLTSFAILLDMSRQGVIDRQQAQILTFITYIGCGVSAIFLAVTILTYLSFEKLLRDIPAKILVQLCISLFLLNLVYLLNGWLALYPTIGLCISTAFFLHYFLLTSFTWAGLEALHMYLSIIQVFTPYLSRYMLKFTLMGWGIPLIVVIIVISVDKDNYGLLTYGTHGDTDGTSGDFCWLKNDIAFYVGVVAYFLLIFVLCLLVFIVVMVQLARIKRQNPQNQSPNRGLLTDLRSIAGLILLLGLTWGFALFAWGPLYLPFVYLFSIFNSLQGFFIFVFHCAVKENVRKQWRTYLCCGKLRLAENSEWSRTATHNNRTSSVTTATTSALHLTSRSSSVISDSTNSSGSVFADSGISDSNSDVVLNELHRRNLSPQGEP